MEVILILISAFLLDLLVGDPKNIPHLIVGYGNLIAFGEKKLNKGNYLFMKGMLLTMLLVSVAFLIPFMVINYFEVHHYVILNIVVSVILLCYCLANKTLVHEGKAVFNALHFNGLEAGRKRLSWIVGRDTSNLNEQQIRKATFETMSENLSDGIIAPLFYFVCFGVPGAMAYKMINTLDSMIGYKSNRYFYFGKFAARLDDVANFIPSRITAVLILLSKVKIKGFNTVFKEGKKHSSPNAGYPEAALAYVLDCQFGGPNYYEGTLVSKPYIGSNNRKIEHDEIHNVSRINYVASSLFVVLSVIVFLFIL